MINTNKIPLLTAITLILLGFLYIYYIFPISWEIRQSEISFFDVIRYSELTNAELKKAMGKYMLNYSIIILIISFIYFYYKNVRKFIFILGCCIIGLLLYKIFQSIIENEDVSFYLFYCIYLSIFPISVIVTHLVILPKQEIQGLNRNETIEK